ncbi:MAG TPA: hypothetical protein VMT85_02830 [Thermoanaerobaculia bacterium]|nr:hypothetical protein [Thermoanaerobaculia bacterium]
MIAGRIDPESGSRGQERAGGFARDPLLDRYLDRLREVLELWDASPSARAEILGEIASHVAEARREGRSLAQVLRGLGPADELAEAYGVALLVDRGRGATGSRRARVLRAAGRWLQSLATSVMLALLLIASFALCALGALGSAAALVLPALPPEVLEPTLRAGAPQGVVLAASLLTLALGVQSFRWLRINVRLARTVRWRRRPPIAAGPRAEDEASGAQSLQSFPAPVRSPSAERPAREGGRT